MTMTPLWNAGRSRHDAARLLAFLDPPKVTATGFERLHALHVDVKILTGDNEIITTYICKQVGMPVDKILLGSQIEALSEADLAEAASVTSIFASGAGAKGTHHPCAAEQGACGGIHGRWH